MLCVMGCLLFHNIQAKTGLVRCLATRLVSNNLTQIAMKPMTRLANSALYKKHPWLVRGAGILATSLMVRQVYRCYRKNVQRKKLAREKVALEEYRASQVKELFEAAKKDDLAKVASFINAGFDPNVQDEDGKTVLHIAAHRGHVAMTKRLIDARADPNIQDNIGETPLHRAVWHSNILQRLIDAGANPNALSKDGSTALHIVTGSYPDGIFDAGYIRTQRERPDAPELASFFQIIDVNITPNMRDLYAIWAVKYFKCLKAVPILINAGIQVNIPNNKGLTAIDLACRGGCIADIVQELLKAGGEINIAKIPPNELENIWPIVQDHRRHLAYAIGDAIPSNPACLNLLIADYLVLPMRR
jgi:ankyrin repeat protein